MAILAMIVAVVALTISLALAQRLSEREDEIETMDSELYRVRAQVLAMQIQIQKLTD